jgi:hypothetical protein
MVRRTSPGIWRRTFAGSGTIGGILTLILSAYVKLGVHHP